MTNTLHVFALNEPVTISHTSLTRQKGETPDLPPLAKWLGVDVIDTDKIELFVLDDLSGMTLSDYIHLAFTLEGPIPSDTQIRLNALSGAVLLVPDDALSGPTAPGPQATAIASLPLARADHDASLPKADVTETPARAPAPREPEPAPPVALFALIGMAVVAAIIFFFGWR
ncbi:MAG: hypothetical protein JKY00_09520 [Roseicyclus sp.]|nr:hypothetical protein [Roseicyclus sp.]